MTPALFRQWQDDLSHMSGRMKQMRQGLYDELKQRKTAGSWENSLTDIGMFSFTGLSKSQVLQLKDKYHI
ncbi:hypothetical protein V1525DRAFT_102677 [Lipomyces kononenkoae]|uniref:Uncharacterized protein n=1 Tax=Lipomyces kononenkoae TaxID=34357 RepID=A0ACC3SQS7_LIPKO